MGTVRSPSSDMGFSISNIYVIPDLPMKSIKVIPKKRRGRGRPATGRDPVLAIRLSDKMRSAIDQWSTGKQMTRSEAIRELIERGLKK